MESAQEVQAFMEIILVITLAPKQMEFAVKAVANGLITRRWLSLVSNTDGKCPLCRTQNHTIHHILSGCHVALDQGRFTYRHNSVLRVIKGWLNKALEEKQERKNDTLKKFTLWTDLQGENIDTNLPPGVKHNDLGGWKPDIILSTTTDSIMEGPVTTVWIIELTCPTEQRFDASNDLKRRKYTPLAQHLFTKSNIDDVALVPIEVGARGRPSASLRHLQPLLGKYWKNAIEEAGRAAIIASMQIYYGSESLTWRHAMS